MTFSGEFFPLKCLNFIRQKKEKKTLLRSLCTLWYFVLVFSRNKVQTSQIKYSECFPAKLKHKCKNSDTFFVEKFTQKSQSPSHSIIQAISQEGSLNSFEHTYPCHVGWNTSDWILLLTLAYKPHLCVQNFHIKLGIQLVCKNIWTPSHKLTLFSENFIVCIDLCCKIKTSSVFYLSCVFVSLMRNILFWRKLKSSMSHTDTKNPQLCLG